MTSDDFQKKRVMRNALDSGCGTWAPIILPVAGVGKDEISATILPFSRDGASGSTRASTATTQDAVEPNYLLMRVGRSDERRSPTEERRMKSR